MYHAVVIQGAQKLRSKEDPMLTDVCLLALSCEGLMSRFTLQELIRGLLHDTSKYWQSWISRSTYKGRWRESVHRSALALKLLIFEPTGAVIASPTFSLPEFIGGTRGRVAAPHI